MSVSSYQRLCHAGREHALPDAYTMTLAECVAETGWKPELCLSIPEPDEQLRALATVSALPHQTPAGRSDRRAGGVTQGGNRQRLAPG